MDKLVSIQRLAILSGIAVPQVLGLLTALAFHTQSHIWLLLEAGLAVGLTLVVAEQVDFKHQQPH